MHRLSMFCDYLFNFPLGLQRTHLWESVNTAAVFLYWSKYLERRHHAVAKLAAGPAIAPLFKLCRGQSTGVPQCAPAK